MARRVVNLIICDRCLNTQTTDERTLEQAGWQLNCNQLLASSTKDLCPKCLAELAQVEIECDKLAEDFKNLLATN